MRPAFKIPTRYELSGSLLLKEYEKINSLVEEQIAAAESVAIICDGWSNLRNDSIINFVVTTPFPLLYKIITTGKESHTGEYIAREINLVIEKISLQKVFGLVTDNTINMKTAWNILKQENNTNNLFTYGCFAHSLNLLFSDFKKLPMLKTFLVGYNNYKKHQTITCSFGDI